MFNNNFGEKIVSSYLTNQRVVICIPSHCSPEPRNPSLHVHVNDPTVLAHSALSSQLSVPLSHSLISEDDNHRALLVAVVCFTDNMELYVNTQQ